MTRHRYKDFKVEEDRVEMSKDFEDRDYTRISKTADLAKDENDFIIPTDSTPKALFKSAGERERPVSVITEVQTNVERIHRKLSTNDFIKKEIFGEEKRLIQIIADFEAGRVEYEKISIEDLLSNFQFAKVSARALKKLNLEISLSEARFYKINEGDIRILAELGIINTDLVNLSKSELIYTSTVGVKLFASHSNNLLVIQKPIIVKGRIVNTIFYYFRVFNGKPNLFRVDKTSFDSKGKKVEKHIIIPSDILSKTSRH
ncbi:MAG: hypothetical protein RBS56_04050 [Candidatus Gracilibacteria bacterium]|jgi:hypothetical protein|nr:hypothetical protein [Candidatus Gracilibacteria bacterium]